MVISCSCAVAATPIRRGCTCTYIQTHDNMATVLYQQLELCPNIAGVEHGWHWIMRCLKYIDMNVVLLTVTSVTLLQDNCPIAVTAINLSLKRSIFQCRPHLVPVNFQVWFQKIALTSRPNSFLQGCEDKHERSASIYSRYQENVTFNYRSRFTGLKTERKPER